VTYSIVAGGPESGDWGVAVASKFPAVGAVVPWARAGAGCVATQAWANTSFGPSGLALMAEGLGAEEVLATLVGDDEGRAHRQVGLVDREGTAATFTGDRCMPWAGGMTGEGYACQGNILAGPEVVSEMARAFLAASGDLADRLVEALEAGEAAGGDRRGRQSAALLVVRDGGGYGGRSDRYIDVRVDDHADPLRELRRIFSVYDRELLVRNDPLLEASADLVTDLQRRLTHLGHYGGGLTGTLDEATRAALTNFAGEYNLEGRLRDDERLYESLVRDIRDLTPELRPPVQNGGGNSAPAQAAVDRPEDEAPQAPQAAGDPHRDHGDQQ
jgi:uncharacterized Ntn-hydrolase superfamily protein